MKLNKQFQCWSILIGLTIQNNAFSCMYLLLYFLPRGGPKQDDEQLSLSSNRRNNIVVAVVFVCAYFPQKIHTGFAGCIREATQLEKLAGRQNLKRVRICG